MRGRRGQVAPVATILGLLLVVTFVANYLASVLPAQMAANETSHAFLVQNQVGRLATLATDVSERSVAGTQVIQPISLGSEGVPPFAAPDASKIVAAPIGSGETINFTLSGPYNPPTGGTPNVGNAGGCPVTKNGTQVIGITCTGSHTVIWNFSTGNHQRLNVSGNGGLIASVNFTTSYSVISVGNVGGSVDSVKLFGSHNKLYVNSTGGPVTHVMIVGDYNSLYLGGTGGPIYRVYEVGNYNSVTATYTGGGNILVVGYGTYDSFTNSGSGIINVYYNGFDDTNPTSNACPYGNLANTDSVATTSGSKGNVTYNNTNYSHANGSGNASGWSYYYNNPPPSLSACPFVASSAVGQTLTGAGFSVQMLNAYLPEAVVAFDQGGVVYAVPAGVPTFVDPPPIEILGASATIWMPVIISSAIPGDTGTGTTDVVLTLVGNFVQSWPAGGWTISGSSVTVTVLTQFGTLWQSYFQSEGVTSVSCHPLGSPSTACPTTFTVNGPLAKVVASIPLTVINLDIAEFSLAVV